MKKSLLLIALLATLTQAQAQNVPNINQTGTLVELCGQADEEVVQDRARVSVSFASTKQDKKSAANQVNQKMTEVLAALKAQYPAAQVMNQSYNTSQDYDDSGKAPRRWTVTQAFQLEITGLDEVPDVVQTLQNLNMVIGGVDQFVSKELRKHTQERLYVNAFEDVQMRLAAMSKGLGKSDAWEIVHINSTGQSACASQGGMYTRNNSVMMDATAVSSVAKTSFVQGKETVAVHLWIAAKMK